MNFDETKRQFDEIGARVIAAFDFKKFAEVNRLLRGEDAETEEQMRERAAEAIERAILGASWNDEGGEAEVYRFPMVAKATRRKWLDDADAFTGRLGKYCLKVELWLDMPKMPARVSVAEEERSSGRSSRPCGWLGRER